MNDSGSGHHSGSSTAQQRSQIRRISSILGCCEVNTEGSVKYSGMHSSGVHSNIRSMLSITPSAQPHFPGYSLLWKLLRTTTRSSEIGMQRAM